MELICPQLLSDAQLQPTGVLLRLVPWIDGTTLSAPVLAEAQGELANLAKVFVGIKPMAPAPADVAADAAANTLDWPVLEAQALQVREAGLHTGESPALAPKGWLAGAWFRNTPPGAQGAQATSRASALKLLQLISSDAEIHDIEEALRRDAQISYQLLRLVNSAAVGGGRREVGSLSQAVLMLGRNQLKRWVNLILFAARPDEPRSATLFAHVAWRARVMELCNAAMGGDKSAQDAAFMAGMFSWLDVLFGKPIDEVIRPLQIAEPVRQAVLAHEGPLGALLELAKALEQADESRARSLGDGLALNVPDINAAAIAACAWTFGVLRDQRSGGGG